jgi:hypothetical protein
MPNAQHKQAAFTFALSKGILTDDAGQPHYYSNYNYVGTIHRAGRMYFVFQHSIIARRVIQIELERGAA